MADKESEKRQPPKGKKGRTPPRIEGLFSGLERQPLEGDQLTPAPERDEQPARSFPLPPAYPVPAEFPEMAEEIPGDPETLAAPETLAGQDIPNEWLPVIEAAAPAAPVEIPAAEKPLAEVRPDAQLPAPSTHPEPAAPVVPPSAAQITPLPSMPLRKQGSRAQESGAHEQVIPASDTLTPLGWDSLRVGKPVSINAATDQPAMLAYARLIEQAGATDTATETQTGMVPALLLEVMDEDPSRVWSEDELMLVEQVTDQLTLALENARLFEESRLRSEQLAILNEMSRNLSAQLNVAEVIETVYQYTSRLLDTSNFYIALYDEECQAVSFPIAIEDNERLTWRPRPSGDGLTEYIIRTHQPVLVKENMIQAIREVLGIEAYGRLAQSWLGVPLVYANQAIGVMAVQNYTQSHRYDEGDRDVLMAIASQAAVALQNARLYAEERRRRQIADTLSGIARTISATLDVSQIALQTLEQMAILIPYAHASVRLVNRGRQQVLANRWAPEMLAAPGVPAAPEVLLAPPTIPDALLEEMLRSRVDAFLPDLRTEPRSDLLVKSGLHSWIAAPLLAGEQLVGFLEAGHAEADHYNISHMELLRTIAAQIAVAIQNARLFVETQEARDALQVSVRYQESLARAVAALTERGISALPEVLETLGEAAQVSRAYYFESQMDAQGPFWCLTAEWRAPGMPSQMNNRDLRRVPAHLLASWLETMRSLGYLSVTTAELSQEDRELFEQLGARSVVQFVVTSRNDIPGCIGFAQNDRERDWTSDEIAALQTAASALSSTIAREDLFSQVQTNLAETEAQYNASAQLNSANSYDEILNVLRQFSVLGHINATSVTLNLFDRPWTSSLPAEWLIPIARWAAKPNERGGSSSTPPASLSERYPISEWQSTEKLLDAEHATVVLDVENDPRLDATARKVYLQHMGARSLIFMPLNVAGRWIGHIIGVYRRTTNIPEHEVRRLASLAGQAAVAVESLRLLEETRQRNEELATINQITGAVSRTLELDQVLSEILTRVLAAVEFDAGLVSISDPVDQQLSLAVQQNLPDVMSLALRERGLGGTLCDIVYQSGEMLYAPDLSTLEAQVQQRLARFENLPAAYAGPKSIGLSSFLGVPLMSKGAPLGTVCIFSRELQTITPARLSLMEAIGQQVGVVIENARLFHSTQTALSETDTLYRASAELTAVQTYEDILNTLRKYSILGDVDHSISLDLFEHPWLPGAAPGSSEMPEKAAQMARWLTPILVEPESNGNEVNLYNLREFPPARGLMRPDSVIAVQDLASDSRLDNIARAFYQAQGGPAPFKVRGVIVTPLVAGGLWIGFIHAVYLRPGDWQESDLRRLEVLAGQAAVAAQNLRQFQQIQERAQYEYQTREIGSLVSASIDRDTILRSTARALSQALSASHVVVRLNRIQAGYMYDRDGDHHYELGEPQAQAILTLCTQSASIHRAPGIPGGLPGTSPRSGGRAASWSEAEIHRHGPSTDHLFAPITLRGELVGAIDVFDLNGRVTWDENDVTLIQTISSQVALSLDNARLLQETQSALSETETLYQASAELNAVQSYEDVLETLRKYTILGQADKLLNISLFNRPWNTEAPRSGKTSGIGADTVPLRNISAAYGAASGGSASETARFGAEASRFGAEGARFGDMPEGINPIASWTTLPQDRLQRRYAPRNFPAARLLSPSEPVFVEDISLDSRLDPDARRLFLENFESRSTIFVPLNVGGSWIGFINGAYSLPTHFDEQELRRLSALASQAAVAVQNLNSVELAQQRAKEAGQRSQELALINRVVTSVSASLDLQHSLDIVTRELASMLDAFTGIALLDRSRQMLKVVTNASPYEDTPSTLGLEIPLEGNISSQQVIETRRSLLVEDPQHAEITASMHAVMRQLDVRSLVIIPLVVGAEVIGTVAIEVLHEARGFSQEELRLGETIVFQAAAAIQNARLFEQTQLVLAETEALYQAGARFQIAKTYAEILEALREYTVLGTGGAAQAIYLDLYDHAWEAGNPPEGSTLIAQWIAHSPGGGVVSAGGETGSPRRLLPTSASLQNTLGSRSIAVLSRPEELRPAGGKGLASLYPALPQAQTAVIAPLVAGGEQIGHVCALYAEATHPSDVDQRRLSALAGQAAVAIQTQRLLEESQRRARQLQTAAEIARDTSGTLALESLLQRTVNLLCERFGYYHASVFLTDESGSEAVVRESTGLAGEEMKRSGHRLAVGGASVIGRVTANGLPLVVSDVGSEEARQFYRPNPLLPFTRSELGIPLKTGNRVIGALDVQATRTNAFSGDDVAVLGILADQIAVAVDNARAYEISQTAVEEIREADRLKTQFLANMSHELRTPLNSIIGFSRVILKGIDGPVTDQQTQDLTAIYNSGQHLLGLINDVLDLSKIEAGKMELGFEDNSNLTDIIRSVMSTTIGLVKDKQIQLKTHLAPDLPLLSLDPMKIRQVLINLLSNASKFTEQGSITVEAELAPVGRSGTREEVIVRVVDTGPGIAPKDQAKLFQPFSQVDGSLTRKTGGSGLGLSICHHLIRLHGGRIGLESEVGHGTTFYFTLPVSRPQGVPEEIESAPEMPDLQKKDGAGQEVEARVQTPAAEAASMPGAGTPPAALPTDGQKPAIPAAAGGAHPGGAEPAEDAPDPASSKVSPAGLQAGLSQPAVPLDPDRLAPLGRPVEQGGMVLTVDRDQQVIELYRRYLTGHNYTLISLTELDQTSAVARGIQPSAITLDVSMRAAPHGPDKDDYDADLDGWKVLEQLKRDPATRHIPVIVCTIAADPERAMRLGAADYLLKPILEDDLVQALAKLKQR